MAEDLFSPSTSDAASVALLRGLRAGTVDTPYIHRADVCGAAPEDLVGNLESVPGTDLSDCGYNAIWFSGPRLHQWHHPASLRASPTPMAPPGFSQGLAF
ncbi:unnamed protein product [Urochloa humidicola]